MQLVENTYTQISCKIVFLFYLKYIADICKPLCCTCNKRNIIDSLATYTKFQTFLYPHKMCILMLRTSFTVRLQILYIPYLPTTILRHSSSALNVGVTFTKTFLSNITCWNTHKKNPIQVSYHHQTFKTAASNIAISFSPSHILRDKRNKKWRLTKGVEDTRMLPSRYMNWNHIFSI